MLAPQFTIRRMLAATTVVALLSLLASLGMRGSGVAMALTITLVMAAATLVVLGVMFLLASIISGGFRVMSKLAERSDAESPFAEHRPPPRMVRPEDPI